MNEPCGLSIGDNNLVINIGFRSKRGRNEFQRDWPKIRAILETYIKMDEFKPAEMSTPQTEKFPFVPP